MRTYYLGIDIGASSGRHMIGWIENGTLQMEEIHRFENKMINSSKGYIWDADYLFAEILAGMKKCGERGDNSKERSN